MPRPRDIVGLKTTASQRSQAIFEKTIKLYEPFRVFKQKKADGFKNKGWCLVYVKPITGEREMIMQDLMDKQIANDFRDLMEKAWFRGFVAQE